MFKPLKRGLEAIIITTALSIPLKSQNIVNIHVQSVPSLKNAHSGITLTAIPGPMSAHTETDRLTGNGTLNMPTGTYELMIQTLGHRRYIDTLTINSNQDIEIQVPEWIPTISTYFTDAIDFVNCLLGGYGSQGGYRLFRWRDEDQPIRIFHENTPANTIFKHNYESAKTSIFEKTTGTAKFREADADSIVGVRFQYKPRSEIPWRVNGYTVVDTWYPDFTPKHMTVTIANDEPYPGVGTYLGELCRVLRLFNTSPDIMHVMFTDGNFVKELSVDEGNALNIIYKLKLNTDTRKFKPIKDTTILGIKDYANDNPDNFILEQNYPNPFNSSTIINFSLPRASHVRLSVYNTLGQEVATLVNETREAGTHTAIWDGASGSSGVYFYRFSTGYNTQTRKLLLLK